VTLACALPVYAQVSGRSFVGQGSLALLENILPGWWGRLFVLALLGFAATDFVITMTLSAADAATHAVENPYLHPYLHHGHLWLTLVLLALLAVVFLKGFREAIELATAVCVPYLILNAIVLVRAFGQVMTHPALLAGWRRALEARGDWTMLFVFSALAFPRLALGLSGFETGVSVMPLIRGRDDDDPAHPAGRIRNTRRLLFTAAVIMSVMLTVSSFVTVILIPPAAYREGGPASGRAIAWLAHQLLGNGFGSLYDFSTILILWFAGASAMAGLLHLIPRYLPRVGLAPAWTAWTRPLVLTLFTFDVIVTLIFRANVEAQGGAYATGVLVLMLSAAFAASLTLWREGRRLLSAYCWLVTLVFLYTTIANVIERPDGIIIATIFILFILAVSAISRSVRATELRITDVEFVDEQSRALWNEMRAKKVNLIPVYKLDEPTLARKAADFRRYYRVDGPLAFAHVTLVDNRSEFIGCVCVEVRRDGDNYTIESGQAVAIANTLAYFTEELKPTSVVVSLSQRGMMLQALRYLLFGEGETGLMIYTILRRRWEGAPPGSRPLIFLRSE
ncbi:MAG TPA: hypothetical protein VFA04_25025, partial [Bryobacteraceae bacterium]|nr:hypothetical protein [Bryobacteraceae bacterium]